MLKDTRLPLLFDLFENLPMGVVVLDSAGRVVVYNQAEERLAGRKKSEVMGREFFIEVAPCLNVRNLGQTFTEKIGREPLQLALDVSFPFPFLDRPRDVHIKLNSFEADGRPYAVLLVEDVSAARAVDRMKETLQNLLIHDLKNPLTVVLANLNFLKDVAGVSKDPEAMEAALGAAAAGDAAQPARHHPAGDGHVAPQDSRVRRGRSSGVWPRPTVALPGLATARFERRIPKCPSACEEIPRCCNVRSRT